MALLFIIALLGLSCEMDPPVEMKGSYNLIEIKIITKGKSLDGAGVGVEIDGALVYKLNTDLGELSFYDLKKEEKQNLESAGVICLLERSLEKSIGGGFARSYKSIINCPNQLVYPLFSREKTDSMLITAADAKGNIKIRRENFSSELKSHSDYVYTSEYITDLFGKYRVLITDSVLIINHGKYLKNRLYLNSAQ